MGLRKTALTTGLIALLAGMTWPLIGCNDGPAPGAAVEHSDPFRLIVMDPLADHFTCRCAPPSSWHHYAGLRQFLADGIAREVELLFAEDLAEVLQRLDGPPGIIVGKQHTVQVQARAIGLPLHPIARLSDGDGSTTFRGLFVVTEHEEADTISELRGRRITIGPEQNEEKHGAALAALGAAGVRVEEPLILQRCPLVALAVYNGESDAAVISDYALPMLSSDSFFPAGSLRVLGETGPVPFLTVFSGPGLAGEEIPVVRVLMKVASEPRLLADLKSRDGFKPIE